MTALLITGSRDASAAMLRCARRAVLRALALNWTIIVGDAQGVDHAVIKACCELGVPFKVYGITTGPRHMCCKAHRANYSVVQGNYLKRDRHMVHEADRVFAIWNGTSNGTWYTYQYAVEQHKQADIWLEKDGAS